MDSSPQEVTRLLNDWSNGDREALEKLIPLVYGELHRIARRYMSRQNPGHTLQPTALINEAFIKLIGHEDKQWHNRSHFFGVAAQAMRHILVDYARSKRYAKRGGGEVTISIDEALTITAERAGEILALNDALTQLALVDSRKCKVVEMRYFGGMSVDETARALNVSKITVMRDWSMAKSWLFRELS